MSKGAKAFKGKRDKAQTNAERRYSQGREKAWLLRHKLSFKRQRQAPSADHCLNSVHRDAPDDVIVLLIDGMVTMSHWDLDLTTKRRRPHRSLRIMLAAGLFAAVGALAFNASEAAQPTVIIPPQAADQADLPPIIGEFTGSIVQPARLAQSASAAEPSVLSMGERTFLLSLLMVCFAVMSLGSFSLWRRGFREMAKSHVKEK